ncbi:MAG: alpha/beta hydrolase, partial [Pseudolabrys sp.]
MILLIIAVGISAILAMLAVITLVGTALIERGNPPAGRFVEVDGGRLHILELGAADAPPLVLLHGASGNLGDLRIAIGDKLAVRYRVILVDRPGHGWSDRPDGVDDASPARQAALIHQALTRIGVKRPILLGHSWSGALATAYALNYPDDVAGLVLLAPATHRWPGDIAWINRAVTAPLIGPLMAHTIVLPLGYFLMTPGVQSVFAPQAPPPDYIARSGARMILRPSEFVANAQDIVALKPFVTGQSPRYPQIKVPLAIIADDDDTIVYTRIHSRPLAGEVPQASLTIIPGIGHMVPH